MRNSSAGLPSIVFVENREKTQFWAAVARVLQEHGFAIHWIVQNHMFGSALPGTVHTMPYPERSQETDDDSLARYPILKTDRGRQYFGSGSAHYPHYANQIARILDLVKPCLVVGEATLFHELLTVSLTEERGIPFIHPAAERYPEDRFVMFNGTSQEPYVKSGEALSRKQAIAFARCVLEGTERPAYMKRPSGFRKRAKQVKWIWTRARIWLARLQGERYNTPSLLRKRALSRWANDNRKRWENLQRSVPYDKQAIMYPMHVAPEANIDVWGRPYDNQVEVVKRLLSASPDNVCVAVKANPYPKYEISDELLELADRIDRLILLPITMPMPEAMQQCSGAVTVSGTIAFEAIFGKGRCLALRHPIIDEVCPDFASASPEEAVARLLSDPQAGRGNDHSSVALLQAITARSYSGLISDPFSNPSCIHPHNIALIATGIKAAAGHAIANQSVNVKDGRA